MYYATPQQRDAAIAGLRELADFLEANPEVPMKPGVELQLSVFADADSVAYAEIDRIADLLDVEPRRGDEDYRAERFFGSGRVAYRALAISTARMDRYYALCSYDNCIDPDPTPAV